MNNDVHDGVVGIHQGFHHAGTARGLSLIQRVLDTRDAVATDDRDKVLRTAVDKAAEGLANTWDAAVVESHEGIGEGDQHEEAEELPHVETLASVGGGQRFLHPKPDEHDGRESDAHANPQSIDCGRRCGGQCVTSLCDPIQHSHTSPLAGTSTINRSGLVRHRCRPAQHVFDTCSRSSQCPGIPPLVRPAVVSGQRSVEAQDWR